jgi:N-acetylglucosaminyldiphosphoundecaprenol N-acetyl-beta-D-mannosaminyltransferase
MKDSDAHGYSLLGTRVHALTVEDLLALMDRTIQHGERKIFTSHNLHSLYLHRHDKRLWEFYRIADYVRIDGMSVVLIGQLLGLPLQRKHRVTYVDWFPLSIAQAAGANWRVFYLGSQPGVAERAAVGIRRQFPGLQIETSHGFFDARLGSPDNERVIAAINAFQPQVLMVGMGMPRQQHWVLENHERLQVNVISTSGAALDYVAGQIPTPPRWAGRMGLEWLFRLGAEPRRLAGRYLVEPWALVPPLAAEVVAKRLRRYRRGGAPAPPPECDDPNA